MTSKHKNIEQHTKRERRKVTLRQINGKYLHHNTYTNFYKKMIAIYINTSLA